MAARIPDDEEDIYRWAEVLRQPDPKPPRIKAFKLFRWTIIVWERDKWLRGHIFNRLNPRRQK